MNKKVKFSNVNLVFEELEPRLLLSADGLAVITEANVATTVQLVLGDNEINTLVVQNNTEQSSLVVQTKQYSSELVILDSRVPNFQQLHNDIIRAQQQGRNINVVILDVHRDGLEQIYEALSKYNNLDAVHIVSHGESGKLQLGATQLDKHTLKHRSEEIKQWQAAFVESGDLLLYGCNLAGTTDGQALVNELAKHTAADVAASDDLTGNSLLGGDWDLEYQTGEIEASLVFSDNVQQDWQGTLNTAPVITTIDPAINYTENDPATILFANATVFDSDCLDYQDGTLTVSFSAGGTINDELTIVENGIVTLSRGNGYGNGNGNGNININSNKVASFTGGTGGTPLVITWDNDAFDTDVETVLQQIAYHNTSDNPDATTRTIDFVLTDGDGGTSNIVQQTVYFSTPIITSDGGGDTASINVAENTTSVTTVTATDANFDTLTYSISGGADAALFNIDANSGTLTFISAPNFEAPTDVGANNVYDMTVQVSDGILIDTQAISVTVTDINDAPILGVIGNQSVDELVTLTFTATATDSDLPADTLTFRLDATSIAAGMSIDANTGIFSWAPTGAQGGTTPSVIVTVTDSGTGNLMDSQTFIITVNDAPVANNDSAIVNEGQSVNINLVTNDTDADGTVDLTSIVITSAPSNGPVVVNADGTVDYTHDGSEALADSFTYTMLDNSGTVSNTGTVLITVTPVNDIPVIGGVDTGSVTEDVDPDTDTLLETGGALTIVDSDVGESSFVAETITGTYGDLTIDALGNWNYSADNTQAVIQNLVVTDTLTDTISVTSFDGTTHNIVITIGGVNDAPTALSDNPAAVNEGGTAIFDLVANDSDIGNALDLNSIVITGASANGSLVVNGNGTVTYTHDGSETINDSFSYTIADITGAISNIATVTVTVNPVNDAPLALDDNPATVNEGSTAIFDLAANDSDSDDALDLNSIVITGVPANGSLIVNGDGTVSYTHDGSPTISDSFSYTISDIFGAISNVAMVNVTVNSVPTTTGIVDVTVTEDSAATSIDLNAAFDDVDNLDSELTYSITGNTSIGLFSSAAVNAATGELVLDYAADMNGSSQITIRATDPSSASVDTLFTVTVTPVNDSPVLVSNAGMTAVGTSSKVISNAELGVNDIDNTDTVILYTVTEPPTNGVLILNGVAVTSFTEEDLVNNRLSYQSNGAATNDQFAFTVSDGAGGIITGNTFNIVVQLALPEPEVPTTIVDPEPLPDPVVTTTTVDVEDVLQPEVSVEAESELEDWYVGSDRTSPQPQQPELTLEPVPQQVVQENFDYYEKPVEINEAAEINFNNVSTVADIQVKSIKALWAAIDEMKQQIDKSVTEDMTELEFRAAAVSGSGVALTAGVVAWVLRGGALMTSLMSTIPLWKAYDPLPILAYRDDEDEKKNKNITEDKIPASLEEMRKIKALKEKIKKQNQVDAMFGNPGVGE